MLRRALFVVAIAIGCVCLPQAAAAGTTTVTFDDLTSPNRALTGEFPTGVIDWGTGAWYLSGPWGQFTTNSVSFPSASATSGSFTFVSPQRLVQLDAYNGGTGASTVTLTCAGQAARTQSVAASTRVTITTGWTATCPSVSVSSSNGWNTNFDSLVFDNGVGPVISAVQATAITRTSATIVWTSNLGASTQVEYGPSIAYGQSSTLTTTLLTAHTVILSGLSGATQYHYRVRSADGTGNLAVSDDFTFMTSSPFCDPPVTNRVACENSLPGAAGEPVGHPVARHGRQQHPGVRHGYQLRTRSDRQLQDQHARERVHHRHLSRGLLPGQRRAPHRDRHSVRAPAASATGVSDRSTDRSDRLRQLGRLSIVADPIDGGIGRVLRRTAVAPTRAG